MLSVLTDDDNAANFCSWQIIGSGGYAVRRVYSEKHRKHNTQSTYDSKRKVVPMSIVRPVPLSRLLPGTVVWAHIPFADGTGEKSRPAVVIATESRDITLLPGTTSTRRFDLRNSYSEVIDLDAAGLNRPTGISRRPVTVDKIEIIMICGELAGDDAEGLGIDLPFATASSNDAA